MNCPRCAVPLEPRKLDGALDYACLSCDGHAVTLGALRKRAEKSTVSGLWRMAAGASGAAGAGQGPGCPSCSSAMTALTLHTEDLRQLGADASAVGPLDLDVCRGCHIVWFDWGEQEQLAGPMAPPPSAAEVDADRLLAEMTVESRTATRRAAKDARRSLGLADEVVQFVLTLLW